MDNSKFEVLSDIMVERNIIFNILKALSREFEMKEINPDLFKIIQTKYFGKLKSLDIQLSKESRNLNCSKCERNLDDDEPILCCISCGFPFHQKHLNESPIINENYCGNCGSIFQIRDIDGFQTIEIKKIEYLYSHLRPKISEINVKIEGKPFKLKYKVPPKKKDEKIKKGKTGTKCPNCGLKVSEEWRFCKKCGFLLKDKQLREKNECRNCGTFLDPSWRFCKWCGAPTDF